MVKLVLYLFGFILFLCFTACNIEEAEPARNQYLIIASDCLMAKDTLLFRSFTKSKGIKIKILHLSTDSLRTRLRKEGLNTQIDAVILFSTYDMYQLEKLNQLQLIPEDNYPEKLANKYIASSRKWVGIGIDPFVLVTLNDTIGELRSYSGLLKKSKYCSFLSGKSDWYPFYASIVSIVDPKKDFNALDWINISTLRPLDKNSGSRVQGSRGSMHRIGMNNLEIDINSDSTIACNTLLTSYSILHTNELLQKSYLKTGKIIFPNQRIGGSYYNMLCFGIIKQAKNYENALDFFEYLLLETVNKRLNNKWHTFPIISTEKSIYKYQNIRFKKFRYSPIRLTKNYNRIEDILKLSEKKNSNQIVKK